MLSQVLSISVSELVLRQSPNLADQLEALERIEKELLELRLKLSSRI